MEILRLLWIHAFVVLAAPVDMFRVLESEMFRTHCMTQLDSPQPNAPPQWTSHNSQEHNTSYLSSSLHSP